MSDFGTARSVSDACGVTATELQMQAPMGTTIYMSPESVRYNLSYTVYSFLKKTWTLLRSSSNT